MFNNFLDIIIPSYEQPQLLRECLLSVLNQEFTNYRVIIIDDCSDSCVYSYIEEILNLNKNFTFIKNDINMGALASVMKGLGISKSKYFMILHHDDMLDKTFLIKIINGLEANKTASFGYSLISTLVNEKITDDFPTTIRPNLPTGIHDIAYDAVINCWIMFSSAVIRRTSFDEVDGLDLFYLKNINRKINIYRKGEPDLYLFAKLSARSQVYVINERLCFYRLHEKSNTNNNIRRMTHVQDNIRTYDYIFDEIEYFPDDVRMVAKINSIGRLSLCLPLLEVADLLLYRGKLSRETTDYRDFLIAKLRVSLNRLIRDDKSLGYPFVTI